ncbi:MAG TPA: hypothetical protein VFT99_01405 [Roseiflexaceae bacterium]|nr:hypothetical protein [Roseiflexaceae bacterium]
MTHTRRATEEACTVAYAKRERDERIQAAELAGARRDMELMVRLNYYGADLEVAMAYNDPVLFANAVAHLRPQGK